MSRAVSMVSQSSGTVFIRRMLDLERHVVDRRRGQRHHDAGAALGQGPDRGRTEPQRDQAVGGGRPPAPQKMAQHDHARLLAGQRLQLRADLMTDAAQPFHLSGRFSLQHRAGAVLGGRAFRHDDDRKMPPAALALGDLFGNPA